MIDKKCLHQTMWAFFCADYRHNTTTAETSPIYSNNTFTFASDHSSLLGMRPKGQGKTLESLTLHFGHTDNGYIISIKNKGNYHNKIICKGALDLLGAKKSDTTNPTIFTLTDHRNNVITLDDISAPHLPISIKSGKKTCRRIQNKRFALYIPRRNRRTIKGNFCFEYSKKRCGIEFLIGAIARPVMPIYRFSHSDLWCYRLLCPPRTLWERACPRWRHP
ncbi:hypothetical protein ACYZT7_28135 [Pseudomonas sp. RT4P38]